MLSDVLPAHQRGIHIHPDLPPQFGALGHEVLLMAPLRACHGAGARHRAPARPHCPWTPRIVMGPEQCWSSSRLRERRFDRSTSRVFVAHHGALSKRLGCRGWRPITLRRISPRLFVPGAGRAPWRGLSRAQCNDLDAVVFFRAKRYCANTACTPWEIIPTGIEPERLSGGTACLGTSRHPANGPGARGPGGLREEHRLPVAHAIRVPMQDAAVVAGEGPQQTLRLALAGTGAQRFSSAT
jgi:hypothetical protein